ncbi:hypothetical protein C0583_00275 [Candidatus Parcubacteria bacterium]|nr:MAG: hypothetical protein C0583_00275 [Candidatus Parcubacteria bacterium]
MKNNFEIINQEADRRRKKAENENKLSISHWKGELHSHTKTDISKPELPNDIVEHRKGSNCGSIPLEALLSYHNQEMKNEFIAITEHSRDGNTEKAINGMTDWFMGMYLSNVIWLQENFSKNKESLSEDDLEKIKKTANEKAKEVALYGDERIQVILNDIEKVSKSTDIKVFKGVEASLMPDGSLDTEMVERGEFDMVNCSIHPDIDKEKFQPIISSSEKYSDLILKGTENEKVNILSHIGSGLSKGVAENLRWGEFAEKAIKNKVAIEINLKKLITFIYEEVLDYEKYPKDSIEYREVLQSKLRELIPILSSENIRNQLKPYFSQGLKIAINTDEHKNKFIDSTTDKKGTEYSFKPRDLRFWRSMKIVEEYFNKIFSELGVKKENIINTFTKEELEEFFKK